MFHDIFVFVQDPVDGDELFNKVVKWWLFTFWQRDQKGKWHIVEDVLVVMLKLCFQVGEKIIFARKFFVTLKVVQ